MASTALAPALDDYDAFGGRRCLDFVNTVNGRLTDAPQNLLLSAADLVVWGRQIGLLSMTDAQRLTAQFEADPTVATAALARAVALRETLYAIFVPIAVGAPPDGRAVERLVDAYRVALCDARLVAGDDGHPWRWEPVPCDDASQLGWLLWPVVHSAITLLTSHDLVRLKRCAGADRGCAGLFVDETRNGSRRWCRMDGCGSRAKMRRLYTRRRAQRALAAKPGSDAAACAGG